MVRPVGTKNKHRPRRYSSDDLEAVLDKLLLTEPGISCRAVAEEYDILEATFRHHKKKRVEGHNTNINRKPLGLTGKRYLTDAEEQIKENHIEQSSGHPITKMICLLMLVEILKNERMEREGEEPEVDLETRYKKNWKGLEGSLYEKWWRGFKQRNP